MSLWLGKKRRPSSPSFSTNSRRLTPCSPNVKRNFKKNYIKRVLSTAFISSRPVYVPSRTLVQPFPAPVRGCQGSIMGQKRAFVAPGGSSAARSRGPASSRLSSLPGPIGGRRRRNFCPTEANRRMSGRRSPARLLPYSRAASRFSRSERSTGRVLPQMETHPYAQTQRNHPPKTTGQPTKRPKTHRPTHPAGVRTATGWVAHSLRQQWVGSR